MSKLEEGKQFYEQQEYDEAIRSFDAFLTTDANHADALFFRGLAYRKVGKFHESVNDLNLVIAKLPEEATLYSERGVSYYHLKDYKKAVDDLNRAVELEPEKPYRYSSRAYVRAYLDVEGAIADYEKAIELDPQDEIAMNNLGLLLENQGNMREAQKRFQQSNKIIGYDPTKGQAKEEHTPEEELDDRKMGQVMLDVFLDKQTRKEYFNYLKNIFKKG